MATSVTDILRRARHLLQDSAGVRWSDEELLLWLNEAQQTLAVVKPDAVAVCETFSCAEGPRQTLPAGGVQLLDVVRNGQNRPLARVQRDLLDAETPDWYSLTATAALRWFTYDARTPTTFYVCPPASAGATLELLYAKMPEQLTRDGNIGVEDAYAAALVNYVCFRAYSKDADFAQSAERARLYGDAFYAALGGKQLVEFDTVQPSGETNDAVR